MARARRQRSVPRSLGTSAGAYAWTALVLGVTALLVSPWLLTAVIVSIPLGGLAIVLGVRARRPIRSTASRPAPAMAAIATGGLAIIVAVTLMGIALFLDLWGSTNGDGPVPSAPPEQRQDG